MIRLAQLADIGGIMAAVDASRAIMQASGNYQWDENYPLHEDFEKDIIEGTLYIIDENAVVAGVFCLNGDEPAEYSAAAWQNRGAALVIHRMAVLPEMRGRGFAGMLLDFACELAKSQGIASLKTDTFSGNIPMNTLFLKHGFRKTGTIELQWKKLQPFYCYEKFLGDN